jgi:hypothetical protein
MAAAATASVVVAWGAAPALAVPQITPSSRDFGSVAIGSTSASMPFTLYHSCTEVVMAPGQCQMEAPYSISPNATGDFLVTSHNCPASFNSPPAAGAEPFCTINVAFRPTVTGARAGQVRGNGTGFPFASLTGNGLAAPVVPVTTVTPAKKKKCKKKKKTATSAKKKKCKKKRR